MLSEPPSAHSTPQSRRASPAFYWDVVSLLSLVFERHFVCNLSTDIDSLYLD